MPHFRMKAAVHLILRHGDLTLLGLRHNTGYWDGSYALPAGHMDGGESPKLAMCREAEEELGIHLVYERLSFHSSGHLIKHDASEYALWFFEYQIKDMSRVKNREPEKCAGLMWCYPDALPVKTVPYIAEALTSGNTYHEWKDQPE